MRRFILLVLFVATVTSCEKYGYSYKQGYGVEFYYITDFRTIEGTKKIISSTVRLSDSVLIRYDDILSYDPDTYTFKVSESLAERFSIMKNNPVHGKAFAVTVNGEIIYTGYFWWGFSSSSVDWVVIDPLFLVMGNYLQVQLGYPGLIEGDYIPDHRNNQRIIDFLKSDNKLD